MNISVHIFAVVMDVQSSTVEWFPYISFIFLWQNNAFLARRLLNGELEPSKILNMTPAELKV